MIERNIGVEFLTSQITELIEILGWAAAFFLMDAIIFATFYINRWRLRERDQKDAGPWIGYTLNFLHGPETGRRYRVKSVQDGFVVLEDLEE